MIINLSHGNGGIETAELIENVFRRHFSNSILDKMEDSATLSVKGEKIAVTTDSFVVSPMFFKGGNIGDLAICGTVNDIAMSGATPKYITCGFIICEGVSFETLEQIAISMAAKAKEANVKIVAGDTKVIEGSKPEVYINTTGVGVFERSPIKFGGGKAGDVIILSGNLGEHHAAIFSERMGISNEIASDTAPLNKMVAQLNSGGVQLQSLRDVTRGGLATVLNELSAACNLAVNIYEDKLPISSEVRGFCEILGLDPLTMANEGKLIAAVPAKNAENALSIMRKNKYGRNACVIGELVNCEKALPHVQLQTCIGGRRRISPLRGQGLPRIC